MTTEAEQLANELTEPVEGFPEPTRLESAAAALLRSQAAQIDAMKLTINNMSGILDDQSDALIHKDAEIERLREILARALAQMRTQRRIDRAEFPSEVEDEIRIELGERV